MRLNKVLTIVSVAALTLLTALPASAQGSIGFGFSHFGRHSGFGVGFSTPIYYGPHYYRPYYYQPVVVEQPACCWVPGHYEAITEQVWVRGPSRRVWVEPTYQTVTDPSGNTTKQLVRDGYWSVTEDPGHYENRTVQVWVPGHYA